MYVKFVSDLDYSFNKETGKWDVPTIEWETEMGSFRQRFESEEARSKALDENETYNQSPEVKAFIESMHEINDKHSAEIFTSELFDNAIECNKKVALSDAIDFAECWNYCNSKVKEYISKLVCQHNKLILRTQFAPAPAVNRIADFM